MPLFVAKQSLSFRPFITCTSFGDVSRTISIHCAQ